MCESRQHEHVTRDFTCDSDSFERPLAVIFWLQADMFRTRTLVKACGFGTFGLIGVSLMIYEEIQGRIRRSKCFTSALEYVDSHKGVKNYFGEPMRTGFITNIEESENQSDSILWYKVPLRGPHGRGNLYYKAVKEETWFLSKVELELEKVPGKKFVLMDENRRDQDVAEDFISTENDKAAESDSNNISVTEN